MSPFAFNGARIDCCRVLWGCCSLDLKWSLKACVLKAWSLAQGATGRWWDLLEVRSKGRKWGHWGHVLEGYMGTLLPSSSSLLLPGFEVSNFVTVCSPPWCGPLPLAQKHGFSWSWSGPSTTVSQNQPFLLLSWFNSGISYSNRKLTTTGCLMWLFYDCFIAHSFW